MTVLQRNGIKLNFVIGYVGLDKGFISIEEILKDIDNNELEKLDHEIIGNLYSSDSDLDKFKNILHDISNISEKKYSLGLKIWGIAFLKDIKESNGTVFEKLKQVANLWADFNYIGDWRNFIYYMPVEHDDEIGENALFQRFSNYLDIEFSQMDMYFEILCE